MKYFAAIETNGEGVVPVLNVYVADNPDLLPGGFTYIGAHANVYTGCMYNTDTQEFVGVAAPEPAPEPEPGPEPVPVPPCVSPVEFKLLFTAMERIAINMARAEDPVIEDFFSIIDDPRLTLVNLGLASTVMGIDYLIGKGLVEPERREEILGGNFK